MCVVASEMTNAGAGSHRRRNIPPSKKQVTSGGMVIQSASTRQHDHRFRGGFEGAGSGVSEVLMSTVYHSGGKFQSYAKGDTVLKFSFVQ